MNEGIFSVTTALSKVAVNDSTLHALTKDTSQWEMFGKKNSHLLRAKLFRLYADAKLDSETIFVIHFLFAVIKNKGRVLSSLAELPDEVKSLPSVTKAKDFITESLVQYVSAEGNKMFAVVHLPTTMPGLDVLSAALICDQSNEALANNIITRQTFAQININAELQEKNKAAQRLFWDSIVKSSKNQARVDKRVTEELKFHEPYYNTAAADRYKLINLKMQEVAPKNESLGYSMEEVTTWFYTVKTQQKAVIEKIEKGKAKV